MFSDAGNGCGSPYGEKSPHLPSNEGTSGCRTAVQARDGATESRETADTKRNKHDISLTITGRELTKPLTRDHFAYRACYRLN